AEKPPLVPLDAVPAERPLPGQGEPTPVPQPTPAPVEARSSRFEEKLETIQQVDEADMSTRQRTENWDRPAQVEAAPVAVPQIAAPPVTAPQVVAPQQGATPPPRGVGAWYTVQPGDSLSRIASQYNLSVFTLVQANALPNPNLIRVGQQI